MDSPSNSNVKNPVIRLYALYIFLPGIRCSAFIFQLSVYLKKSNAELAELIQATWTIFIGSVYA